ncbi:hypothetical protein MFMK1_003144 [Metallumcola ferriviriculae]|uniref:Uncharacterized protein n=1 Tax=Metallumcola ferriviriculae TaxID=3039180 RepID=A0AAU0USQ4_9FIRM|nr:hypothetical protein MFMK1_003144 [Desulfitibacteraceae bacterium MK1]
MRKIKPPFKINDRLLLAAFAGFIAALAANLSLYLINQAIIGQNVNMPQVTLGIFLNNEVTNSLLIKVLGVIWSTIVGGVYSLLYLVALELTGWNNLWLKAIIVVNGTWLLGAGFMMNLLNITNYTRDEPLSIAAFYIAHMLFATYLYLLVDNFGQQYKNNKDDLNLKTIKILQQDTRNRNRYGKTIKPKKIK